MKYFLRTYWRNGVVAERFRNKKDLVDAIVACLRAKLDFDVRIEDDEESKK